MRQFAKILMAAVVALAGAAPALASPEGIWEIEMRDSRYEVSMCGDGTELCGTLVWLGGGADNAENRPYMNKMVINYAKPVGPNRWRGELNVLGTRANGTITLVNEDQIRLQGCVALIFCKTLQLYRYAEAE